MIESVRRQSRSGLGVVISVLVVVGAFWAFRITESQRFQTYISEFRLKQTLRAVKPPPGAKLEGIMTYHYDIYGVVLVEGIGIYSSDLEFDKVKSHYLGEFARRGFVYQGDTVKNSHVEEVNFCAPDYRATLSAMSGPSPRRYVIFIDGKNGSC